MSNDGKLKPHDRSNLIKRIDTDPYDSMKSDIEKFMEMDIPDMLELTLKEAIFVASTVVHKYKKVAMSSANLQVAEQKALNSCIDTLTRASREYRNIEKTHKVANLTDEELAALDEAKD